MIVLGGDGTLNEAANGLAGTDCALGVLPGGSTNVFARTIGMTNDPIEATGELLAALGAGPGGIRTISVGNVNGRRLPLPRRASASTPPSWPRSSDGPPSSATSDTPSSPTPPSTRGPATTTAAIPTSRPSCTAGTGGGSDVEDGYFAICLKSNPYTFLGRAARSTSPLAPGWTRPLSVVVLRSLSAATMLGLTASALRGGEGFSRRRKVTVVGDVVRAVLAPTLRSPYQVDGDFLGDTEDLEFRWEPDHLRLIVPTS